MLGESEATQSATTTLTSPPAFCQFADHLEEMVMIVDADLALTYINDAGLNTLGISTSQCAELYREGFASALLPTKLSGQLRQAVVQVGLSATASRDAGLADEVIVQEVKISTASGMEQHFSFKVFPLIESHQPVAVVCMGLDKTQEHAMQKKAALTEKVFESGLTGLYITDENNHVVEINNAFSKITGYRAQDIIGKPASLLDTLDCPASISQSISNALTRKQSWEGELQKKRRNGEAFPAWATITQLLDDKGSLSNTIVSFADISEKKNNEVKIQRLAYFDSLTGLPNRSLFDDRLQQNLSRAERNGDQIALLFLDLDRFKAINDSLGHAQGDILLTLVAERLRDCVRTVDTISRMGGDEFTVILTGLKDRQQALTAAAHVSEKIRAVIDQPFELEGHRVSTGASIGIAFYPTDAKDSKSLLRCADTAMYHAKSAGKNNYQFFTKAMNQRALERMDLEASLNVALEKSEFELHFQPILGADSGDTVAVEALIRWHHPEKGLILPAKFIDIAEESGLIKPLGCWSLREACAQMVIWQEQGVPIQRVSVNISRRQFMEGYLLQNLKAILKETGLDPRLLQLELTENTLSEDKPFAVDMLAAISHLGVTVALDDFGVGEFSLKQLKDLPINTLKMDRSFTLGLPAQDNQRVMQGMVSLAHSMEIKVVASGIENPMQLSYVQGLGCEEVQGFMLSQPQAAKELRIPI